MCAGSSRSKFTGTCFCCGKVGHKRENCRLKDAVSCGMAVVVTIPRASGSTPEQTPKMAAGSANASCTDNSGVPKTYPKRHRKQPDWYHKSLFCAHHSFSG